MLQTPKCEYPRMDKRRDDWLNLNGAWDFALFADAAQEAAFAADRTGYDRTITVPFSWVCPLSGVEENTPGIGWYRRKVAFPCKERVFLCFGAVDYLCDVYVNGEHAGSHQGGYSYFEMDVTRLWHSGENTIEVRAEDWRRDDQLYGKQGYGEIQGIWQTVWLEARPEKRIESFRTDTRMDGTVTIDVRAAAPDGETVVAEFEGHTACAQVHGGRARLTLHIPRPHLWSPDDPYLYEGELRLGEDRVHTYFGVREISTGFVDGRGYRWILLNGKPVYLNGTLDQAFNPKGHFTYPSDEDMRMEAWRLKCLGLNMVRIHIKPEEPRKLYWMDKLGVLVMADVPCFWGAPTPAARAAYEREMEEIILRDTNHPSVFAWVVFNESWGLLDKSDKGEQVYLPDTQEWVRRMYRRAKQLEPARLVEDNSPCRYDHVETDLNTWHFYLNGYETVRDHIRHVVEETRPGSAFNFIGGNVQLDAPLMNSECGMVWGVEGSAGDSDLAWQYHYMLNEYRLHEKLCGFVFTEFHDVVNEFNGYYRIDDTDKDFGYGAFCRGMTLRDLHAADFPALDGPPVRTVSPGEKLCVPVTVSSFTDAHHTGGCSLRWELWHDGLHGRVTDQMGERALAPYGWGANVQEPIEVTMPRERALCVLSVYLTDVTGDVISRNFTTFEVDAPLAAGFTEIPACSAVTEGFTPVWQALNGDKLCLGGSGEATYTLPLTTDELHSLTIHAELGAKRVLTKDCSGEGGVRADLDFMHGYLVDRGAFANSYWMSDESRYPTQVEVLVNGESIRTLHIANDWADARGVLSWHHQAQERRLDEAGSYGERQCIHVPSRLMGRIAREGEVRVTFRVKDGGLAVYGSRSGCCPYGLTIELQ